MSLVARKMTNKLRITQHIKYSTFANKIGLTSNCENCTKNNPQHELIKLNVPKINSNRFTLSETYVTSCIHRSFRETAYNFIESFNFKKRDQSLLLGFQWFAATDKLNYEEFFKLLKMPDTFYTWFKITELHVWMILMKVMNENDSNENIKVWKRNGLIEAMWEDAEKRAKMIQLSAKKRRADFSQLFFRFKASLLIYDEGFLLSDMEFASALWHQFFDRKCEDPLILEALVSYCRTQIPHLFTIDINTKGVSKDCEVWLPLKPHFSHIT